MNVARVRGTDPLARIAWAGLLVLALGATGHLWHHLTDPDCESRVQGSAHACPACSALHGGILAGQGELALSPPPSGPARLTLPPTDTDAAHAAPVGPPRGPPTA
ncbi:MAG: hypothetical protein ACRENJ_05710 [Candidatus Eiseniibacteriota bacterium]